MRLLNKKAIGVFDSGLGGLTVVKELKKVLPNERIVYFGDTARVPYGSKSKEVILRYSREISKFLKGQDVKMIVIACNTASAFALRELDFPCEIAIPFISSFKPIIGSLKGNKTLKTVYKLASSSALLPLNSTPSIAFESCSIA